MKIFNKLIFWIFGIAFLVSCKDDMAPQLPEPVVETPEVGERPELKQLRVKGRYLVDADGQTVNLHGFAQTYSPFFNNNAWGNYDVDACLRYNQLMTDRVANTWTRTGVLPVHLLRLRRICSIMKKDSKNTLTLYSSLWRSLPYPEGSM